MRLMDMRGALTFIISLTSVLWISAGAAAQTTPQSVNQPISLEKSFEAAKQDVQNQLLNAPEASYIYLTHWVKIYNQSKSAEDIFSFEKKLIRPIRWLQIMLPRLNKRIGSPMDFQLCRPNGVIWPLSASRPPRASVPNLRPTSRV